MTINVIVVPADRDYCSVDSYIAQETPKQKFMRELGNGAKVREGSLKLPKSPDNCTDLTCDRCNLCKGYEKWCEMTPSQRHAQIRCQSV